MVNKSDLFLYIRSYPNIWSSISKLYLMIVSSTFLCLTYFLNSILCQLTFSSSMILACLCSFSRNSILGKNVDNYLNSSWVSTTIWICSCNFETLTSALTISFLHMSYFLSVASHFETASLHLFYNLLILSVISRVHYSKIISICFLYYSISCISSFIFILLLTNCFWTLMSCLHWSMSVLILDKVIFILSISFRDWSCTSSYLLFITSISCSIFIMFYVISLYSSKAFVALSSSSICSEYQLLWFIKSSFILSYFLKIFF